MGNENYPDVIYMRVQCELQAHWSELDMARNQRLKNQDEILDKIQNQMLEILNRENLETLDFQKLQSLSVSLKAVSEATRLLNTLSWLSDKDG